ncbi:carbohydrate ABC transporter permease [Amycolatopsis suaedae]|uniref:Sugar ABC transporter permease n=1 Tax=Amycolatopsis suaedae TaxID=2510978 RepID=A0A4V2EL36_9PSEU|nr:sugar ABC transporter permease [Amycolatopsis suaedae]RZQ60195.1 sugar ABC transporter permease [Amycolatopsis suaedae]
MRRLTPLLFVAPFFALYAVFGVFPLFYTAWISLRDWHLLNGDQGFLGLANYADLLGDPGFWRALTNTVSIFVLAVVPQLLAALGIAALLNRPLRGGMFWRTGILLPHLVSVVAVALVFSQLFGRDFGLVNWVLGLFGADPVSWQSHTWSSHLAIATMVMWRWTGYDALILLAAMRTVPDELREAAELDGASRWRAFWSVTVPAIRPTLVFVVITSTIGGLQLFTEPLMFDDTGTGGGGNDRQFQTLAMYLYEKGFLAFDAGYAAAVGWVLVVLSVLLAVVNVRLVRRFTGGGP